MTPALLSRASHVLSCLTDRKALRDDLRPWETPEPQPWSHQWGLIAPGGLSGPLAGILAPAENPSLAAGIETVTFEGVDLDGEPVCNLYPCESPAVLRLRFYCSCFRLSCHRHEGMLVAGVNAVILADGAVECLTCGAELTPRRVSDVIVAVIPL